MDRDVEMQPPSGFASTQGFGDFEWHGEDALRDWRLCRFDNDHLLAFGGAKNTEQALTSGTSNADEFTPAFNLTSFEAILAPAAAPGEFRNPALVIPVPFNSLKQLSSDMLLPKVYLLFLLPASSLESIR